VGFYFQVTDKKSNEIQKKEFVSAAEIKK